MNTGWCPLQEAISSAHVLYVSKPYFHLPKHPIVALHNISQRPNKTNSNTHTAYTHTRDGVGSEFSKYYKRIYNSQNRQCIRICMYGNKYIQCTYTERWPATTINAASYHLHNCADLWVSANMLSDGSSWIMKSVEVGTTLPISILWLTTMYVYI